MNRSSKPKSHGDALRGKPVAEVSLEMEVGESLLYSWRKSNLARFALGLRPPPSRKTKF